MDALRYSLQCAGQQIKFAKMFPGLWGDKMVEYLQGAIRLDADYTNNFSVTVTNDEGYPVEGNMTMKIGDLIIKGEYDSS